VLAEMMRAFPMIQIHDAERLIYNINLDQKRK
jgi:hypothetical protein